MTELNTQVVRKPDPEARVRMDACLDLLAEALADHFIQRARREVAAELGVTEAELELRGHGQVHAPKRTRWEVSA
jgi:hypothetical protein